MTAINRSPTAPGPVTELFDRLDQLHLAAGRPSMREIAARAGRGRISSSTVHNVFRNSRVPRWSFLEIIVGALHGSTDEFMGLWQAAWQAENEIEPPRAASPDSRVQVAPEPVPLVPSQRIWSAEIPPRNPNFTGRVAELEMLRANLTDDRRPHPPAQVISGMGGVGKTEIATEYIHRHRDKYEIIWWIRAEHHDRVRDALVNLGQRLELRVAASGSGRDRTIAAVIEALESGAIASWLLVYDNAAQPLDLQRYLPLGPPGGHVIVTSRLQNWPGYIEADSIEVPPFTEEESISFLRRRVPALGRHGRLTIDEDDSRASEAARLAAALGHLPIAVEHAAAYLTETGQSVDDYLVRFAGNAHRLLNEQPSDFPAVAATWTMSTALLTEDAEHLFNLCAFFSPEPIAGELFLQNASAIDDPPGLREFLSSAPRFRAAASQMRRLSLVKVDGARDQIQMHRVVQAVTRGHLRQNRPEMFHAYRAAVDILLAESNPGDPDLAANDAVYDLSLQHLESDRNFLNTSNADLRRLIIDQVRRLHLRGNHAESTRFGQDALQVWRDRLGPDDLQVLRLAVEVAIAMRSDAHAADARELILDTRQLLREHYGEDHEVTLLCTNLYGADLRSRGQLREALDLDLGLLPKFERTFGKEHPRTLNVRNNIAADHRRLGQYQAALDTDRETFEDRRRTRGASDPITLTSYDAIARDLRDIGRYQESLDVARRVVQGFALTGVRENLDWLNAHKSFAAALRKAGYHWEALQESEDVVQRYRDYLGPEHTYTLRAACNLINDRRTVGELGRAEELGWEVLERCQAAGFPSDLGYATQVNLASVLRASGRVEEARRFDEQARQGLIDAYGGTHPFTLQASINYASDLSGCGDLATALRVGHETLARCETSLSDDHPETLMAAVNLAIDEAASGNQATADRLHADALQRYGQTLTMEHPDAQAASQWTRIISEIEPY